MYIENRPYTPMTVGNWLLTFIVIALPFVGFIMQLVWAFSSDTHPSKRTFCQASLILLVIMFALSGLFLFLFGGLAMIMGAASQSQHSLSP